MSCRAFTSAGNVRRSFIELFLLAAVLFKHAPVATGHNRDDGRSYFAGFSLRHQRIGTRGHLTCSARVHTWVARNFIRSARGSSDREGMGCSQSASIHLSRFS